MALRHNNDSHRRTLRISGRPPTFFEREGVQLIRAECALRDLWLHILEDPEVFELIADPINTLIDVCNGTQALDLSSSSSSSSSFSTFSSDLSWEHVFPDNTRLHNPRTQVIDSFPREGLHPDLDPYHSISSSDAGARFWTQARHPSQAQTQTNASSPAPTPRPSQPVTPELTEPVNLSSKAPNIMTGVGSSTESQHQHPASQAQPADHTINLPTQHPQGSPPTTSTLFNLPILNHHDVEPLHIHPNIRETLNSPSGDENPASSQAIEPVFVLYPGLRRSQHDGDRDAAREGYALGWGVGLPWWWTGMGN